MEQQFLEKLMRTPLFRGMFAEEVAPVLTALDAQRKRYGKGAVILHAGERASAIALVLSGSVFIENDDCWGNKSILDRVDAGQVFAEAYACAPEEPLLVSAVAAEASEILFLKTARLLQSPVQGSMERLARNLLAISARKNLHLSRRMFHTAPKSIRERLQSYLSDQATRLGTQEFDIAFNRQQLADYLNVDRSALSNELSKMQKEGLLTVHKNHFRLLADSV